MSIPDIQGTVSSILEICDNVMSVKGNEVWVKVRDSITEVQIRENQKTSTDIDLEANLTDLLDESKEQEKIHEYNITSNAYQSYIVTTLRFY